MNKYKKLLSDTLILGLGTFASKVLVFLLMPLYTACLSPEQYGIADLISQMANLLIPVACAGICDGLFRFTLDSGADKSSVFRTGLRILWIASLAFLVVSPLLFLLDLFSGYAWLIVVYVLASNLHSACAQYIRACDRPRLFSVQGIINTALVIALNLLFLLVFEMGATGYVLSVVLADLLVSIMLIVYARLDRDVRAGHFSRELSGRLIRYSLPMIPTTIFWWITNVSDRFFVTEICGKADNGIYSAAYKIPTLITLLCSVFYEAWQFSAVRDAENKTRSNFFGQVFGYYSALILTGGAGVILLCRVLSGILLNRAYEEAWRYIPVLTLAAVFSALTTFMGSVYLVKKKSMMSFLTSMFGAALNITLNIIMIPSMGVQGAAMATAISYTAAFVLRTITAQRHVSFSVGYVRLTLGTALLIAQCLVTVLEVRLWYVWSAVLALAVVALNARALWGLVTGTMAQLRRRGSDA